jgi:hypothetical protein
MEIWRWDFLFADLQIQVCACDSALLVVSVHNSTNNKHECTAVAIAAAVRGIAGV